MATTSCSGWSAATLWDDVSGEHFIEIVVNELKAEAHWPLSWSCQTLAMLTLQDLAGNVSQRGPQLNVPPPRSPDV